MKGKHHIVIESARLKYEFDIKRNITIIRGDSATGKTTLIELLEDYRGGGEGIWRRASYSVPPSMLDVCTNSSLRKSPHTIRFLIRLSLSICA